MSPTPRPASVDVDLLVRFSEAWNRHDGAAYAAAFTEDADYIAFDQKAASIGGEPIIRWWSDMMEIPCVAFTPVEPEDLDILLPQNPDFIRPSDAMWESAEEAHRIITAIMERISRS